MQFTQNQELIITVQIKQFCNKAYRSICSTHERFYKHLLMYQSDKISILKSIISLSKAHETILMNLCSACENVNLIQIGKLGMKMHFQNVQIIKWLIQNLPGFVDQPKHQNEILAIPAQQTPKQKQILQNQIKNNYYRNRQNSLFTAQGIKNQINKMQKNLQNQKQQQKNQINSILGKKQLIQRMEASQNKNILYQALEVISHQGEIFQNLAKATQHSFNNIYQDLNVKPYAKIKSQVEDLIKQKIAKANTKLLVTLDKYISKRNQQISKNKRPSQEIGVQINMNQFLQSKNALQDKKNHERLQQLTVQLNYQKLRATKLQQLLRNKTNHLEHQLVKFRFQKNHQSQVQILKKSQRQLTSMHVMNEQNKSLNIVDHSNQNSPRFKKKSIKFALKQKMVKTNRNVQQAYKKSLQRIQYGLQTQQDQQNDSKKQKIQKNQIHLESQYTYMPGSEKLITYKKYIVQEHKQQLKIKLLFFSKVFDLKINNLQNKNHSMINFSNLKQNSNCKKQDQEQKSTALIKMGRYFDRGLPKNDRRSNSKTKKKWTKVQFDNQEPKTMSQITNQFPLKSDQNYRQRQLKNWSQNQTQQKKTKAQVIKSSLQNFRVKNNFQILSLNDQNYKNNKNRLNLMINQLKRNRSHKKILDSKKNVNKNNINISNIMDPKILLNLFLTQQNALQAELQFNVSISSLLQDRKHKQPLQSTFPRIQYNDGIYNNQQNKQYFHKLAGQIMNQIYRIRKNGQNNEISNQISTILRKPFSFLKGALNTQQNNINIKYQINQAQIINFLSFVTSLHYNCVDRPCEHLKSFLTKFGICLSQIY